MCLCETWVKRSELSSIQNNIDSHEISNANSYIVFNQPGMSEDDEHSTGVPYGGEPLYVKLLMAYLMKLKIIEILES